MKALLTLLIGIPSNMLYFWGGLAFLAHHQAPVWASALWASSAIALNFVLLWYAGANIFLLFNQRKGNQ